LPEGFLLLSAKGTLARPLLFSGWATIFAVIESPRENAGSWRGTNSETCAFNEEDHLMVMRGTISVNPLLQLRDEVDRLFSNVLTHPTVTGAARLVAGRGFPAVNVWEDTENLFVEAEVPGLKAADLDITVVGDELTIKGQRPEESQSEAAYHRRERGVGSFTRVVRLSSEVTPDKVQAALNDGVLLLTLPKAEIAKPRKIQVKAQ
jgi:HSP20 family protein